MAELNIARNIHLELSKNRQFEVHVGNEAISANRTKEGESHSSYQNQQKYSLVTDNQKQREKTKTYAEALKENFRNCMKETSEERVSGKERNTVIGDNVSYINKAMECNEEDSSEFGKLKPNFSEVYRDLLISEQINSSGDLSLNTHDEEILNILVELQCSAEKELERNVLNSED